LVGPSAQTTLLSIAGGLLSPTSGSVFVGERDISRLAPRRLTSFRREQIGFVFQSFNLGPFLPAREKLMVVAELAGARRSR
jgi:putative ABC transport system ATP-binding protein